MPTPLTTPRNEVISVPEEIDGLISVSGQRFRVLITLIIFIKRRLLDMRIQGILRSKSYCRHIVSRIMRSGITGSVCLCNNLWIKLTSIQRLNKPDCFYTSQILDWKLKMKQVTHNVNRRILSL